MSFQELLLCFLHLKSFPELSKSMTLSLVMAAAASMSHLSIFLSVILLEGERDVEGDAIELPRASEASAQGLGNLFSKAPQG